MTQRYPSKIILWLLWQFAKAYSTIMMRVLGLLISSTSSCSTISCDRSSCRLVQIWGQLLCTTERKAWSRTMLAAQPISASWSPQNNFYVDAMFVQQWLLVPESSLHCSCSQTALQSVPAALIIWSQLKSLDAARGKDFIYCNWTLVQTLGHKHLQIILEWKPKVSCLLISTEQGKAAFSCCFHYNPNQWIEE